MAARFWRCVLAGELLLAGALAWAWAAQEHRSAAAAVAIALVIVVALQFLFVVAGFIAALFLSRAPWRARDAMPIARMLATEPVQFARAQLAMSVEPWLSRSGAHGPAADGRAQPVLLLHGILCNRSVWGRLPERLRAAGFAPVASVNLEPLGADLDRLSAGAQRKLLALHDECHGAPVAIVAHSMGGLVARSLLRSHGPDVVSRVVTVASPHHGTAMAHALPLAAARQIRPGSAWLRTLNAAQEGACRVPLTSIYSRDDSLVVPAQSALLGGARSYEVRGLGHFGLLRSRRALDAIIDALVCA